jgi:hypothetical protein
VPIFSVASALWGLHFIAALNVEADAGLLPIPQEDASGELKPTPSVGVIVAPSAGWVLPTSLGIRFAALYSPSATWRLPSYVDVSPLDPTLLHRLSLSYAPLLSERTKFELGAASTYGEVDFTLVPDALEEQGSARSEVPVAELFATNASASLSHVFAARWTGLLTLPFSYQTEFGQTSSQVATAGESLSTGLSASVAHQLSVRDSLSVQSDVTWVQFSNSEQLATQVQVGWSREMSRLTQANLSLGVGRMDTLRAEPQTNTQTVSTDPQYFGVGGVGFTHQRKRGADNAQLTLNARVDPFLQTIRPQATLTLGTTEIVAKHVEFSAQLAATTVTSPDPLYTTTPGAAEGAALSETGLNAGANFTWGQGRLRYRAGLRGGVRGTHWAADPFEVREQTLLGLFGVNWGIVEGPRAR